MAQLGYRVMDTQIFNLKLSVFATSLYILICSLVGDGVLATDEAIASRWNDSQENLQSAMSELALWRVIEKKTGPSDQSVFAPNPASVWRVPGTS
ncbi:MAG: hypothetical protein LBU69_05290 [Deltaproteobacteria bacterium]|jgi:hypothetical protein|nr:hypothetical protein [Deltaproteobacteria bacterium]